MYFRDRKDVALKLIPLLSKYGSEKGVILAVPRGGVPIGYYLAEKYGFPLELLMSKKIGHPLQPEFAIGAVSLEDDVVDDRDDVPKSYIESEIRRIRENLRSRYRLFVGERQPADLKNKIVIIVDDGVATGNTILSSIDMLRKRKPAKIVVAVPVSPKETAEKISRKVDELICLSTPAHFQGVGAYYLDFSEVSDEEVIRYLKDASLFEKAA
jgi:predicted phosphoribosyltransferase